MKPAITLNKRTIIVFFTDKLGGKEFNNCTELVYHNNNEIEITYDYRNPDKFGCTSYTRIKLTNVEEIKIY